MSFMDLLGDSYIKSNNKGLHRANLCKTLCYQVVPKAGLCSPIEFIRFFRYSGQA